jgi:hypothetical protein
MSIQNLVEFITEHAMKPGDNHGDRPFPGTLPQPVAEWRCEPQRDVAAISQRYVAASTRPWRSRRRDRSAELRTGLPPHLTAESLASAIASRRPQAAGPPRPRSVGGRQLLTEGVVQVAAADLALERLVAAVVVLPLLGVDEAGSPLRGEELDAG